MEYSVIALPFGLEFTEFTSLMCDQFASITRQEFKQYPEWFLNILPSRIRGLEEFVTRSIPWHADRSPDSLDDLGNWFASQVETRPITDGERKAIYRKGPEWFKEVEIEPWKLTNRTFSLCCDVGMYMGCVFINSNPKLKWMQYPGKTKNDIYYGQMVVSSPEKRPGRSFNSTHILIVLASQLASKEEDGSALKALYSNWMAWF